MSARADYTAGNYEQTVDHCTQQLLNTLQLILSALVLNQDAVRLNSLQMSTGRGFRAMLPSDEQHLTSREREAKVVAEAQSQGRNIERV